MWEKSWEQNKANRSICDFLKKLLSRNYLVNVIGTRNWQKNTYFELILCRFTLISMFYCSTVHGIRAHINDSLEISKYLLKNIDVYFLEASDLKFKSLKLVSKSDVTCLEDLSTRNLFENDFINTNRLNFHVTQWFVGKKKTLVTNFYRLRFQVTSLEKIRL